jgi:isopenicillin-N epimerase
LPGSDGILRIDVDKVDPLKALIRARHRIEVSLSPWLSPPGRFLRISAQLYNSLTDYTRLAEAVVAELAI